MDDDEADIRKNYALVVKNKKVLFVTKDNPGKETFYIPSLNGFTDLEDIGKFLVNEFDLFGKFRGKIEKGGRTIFVFYSEGTPKNGKFLGLNEFLDKKLDVVASDVILPEAIMKGFLN